MSVLELRRGFVVYRERRRSTRGVACQLALLAVLASGLMTVTAAAALGAATPVGAKEFSFVVMPDTQSYVSNTDGIATTQTTWIRDSKAILKTAWTSQVGDLVDTEGSTDEWSRIDAAFQVLDTANMPYSVTPGNHDMSGMTSGGSAPHYDATFPPSRFTGKSWHSGGYMAPGQPNYDATQGDSDRQYKDNYQLFSAGGMDFILVSLEYGPTTNAVNWASRVLAAYSSRRAIIATHDWLSSAGAMDGAPATAWSTLKDSCNIFLIVSGHNRSGDNLTSGESRLDQTNTCGNTVHMVMSDYQDRSSVGEGNLRYYVFDPDNDVIHALTYSPVSETYETDATSQFDLAYDMAPSGPPTAPGRPGTPTATAGDASAHVTWTAASANGGTIDHYVVTPYVAGVAQTALEATVGNTTSADVAGLTNGTAYTFTVAAINAYGTGPESSPSASVTSGGTAPVSIGDSYTTSEDVPLTLAAPGVLSNDSDADLDALTAVLVANASDGVAVLNADGSFTYTPNADFHGTDDFTYKANDGALDGNTVTVTISVDSVNDAPVMDSASITPTDPLTATILTAAASSHDVDGDSVTHHYQWKKNGSNITGATSNTLDLGAAGNGSRGDAITVVVTPNDGTVDGASLTSAGVTIGNTAPVSVNDSYAATAGVALNVGVAQGVLANDTDADLDTLTASLVTGPSHGLLTLNTDGSFSYTAVSGYTGSDTFTYRANDGALTSNAGTVSIDVSWTDTAPVAVADAYSTAEDTTLVVDVAHGVLSNDTDADHDTLVAVLVPSSSLGLVTLYADGSFVYKPSAEFNGSDTFTYKPNDGTLDGNTVTVTISVTSVDDAPVVTTSGGAVTFVENGPALAIDPALTVADIDDVNLSGATISFVSGFAATQDVLSFTPQAGITGSYNSATGVLQLTGSATVANYQAALRSVAYTNSSEHPSTATRTISFVATDGSVPSTAATKQVGVTSVNDAPVMDSASISPTSPLTDSLLSAGTSSHDVDGDAVTYRFQWKKNGSNITGATSNTLDLSVAGNGDRGDTIVVVVTPNDGTIDGSPMTSAGVTIGNSAPVAVNDGPFAVGEGATINVAVAQGVLANDTDADHDTLTASLVASPSHGSLTFNTNGSFVYSAIAGFIGVDSFTYRANDGAVMSATGTVSLAVAATVPGVPSNVTATGLNASALVSWAAPADNGGSPITGYVVTPYIGAAPQTSLAKTTSDASTSTTITGLANGTQYTFTVAAINAVGRGGGSAQSNPITPASVPSAPTNVIASSRDGAALVSWVAPVNNGGSPITHYAVMPYINGVAQTALETLTANAATNVTVSGLANGTAYTFKVAAINGAGTGAQSAASAAVTPATVPDRPTGVSAVLTGLVAQVSWHAPASNGGSPITGYLVTSSPEGKTCPTQGALSCTVGGLTSGTSYTFTVKAMNSVGWSQPSDASEAVGGTKSLPGGATTFVPLAPARILDSRDGTGGLGVFHSHVAQTLTVRGHGGVPSNATAVTGNLTVTQQTSGGFLYAGPSPVDDPASSNLNFPTADDRANAITVKLSADGKLSITYAAPVHDSPTAHVLFDVTGYFVPDTIGATYYPLAPTRILDSRDGTGGLGVFRSHVAQRLSVRGHGGVPSNATAVTGNLTVTQQASGGFVYVGPSAADDPTSSNLNFPVGDDRANAVTVQLSADGSLYITYAAPVHDAPTAHVVFDVTGYFVPDMGGAVYVPLDPTRVLDSRDGTGGLGVFHSHVAQNMVVVGHAGVPTSAVAITGNLTVTQQSSAGFLYVGPAGVDDPTSSNLNFPTADDRANAIAVMLSADGKLYITFAAPVHDAPTAQVVLDITGYFLG